MIYGAMLVTTPDPRRDTMASQLVRRCREAILSGEWPPGTKINLDRVRQNFDVSLSPLREALARLIADGLVKFEDNRGYTVAPVSAEDLAEITRLRSELEVLALRDAISVANSDWESAVIRALHKLNQTERDPARPETMEAWEAAHAALHMTLIGGSGMALLVQFCERLMHLNDRYRRVFLRARPAGDRNVRSEHSDIAQAAVARDVECATATLREHILRTGANLMTHLVNGPKPGTEVTST